MTIAVENNGLAIAALIAVGICSLRWKSRLILADSIVFCVSEYVGKTG